MKRKILIHASTLRELQDIENINETLDSFTLDEIAEIDMKQLVE
jgi:hypothetical protein